MAKNTKTQLYLRMPKYNHGWLSEQRSINACVDNNGEAVEKH